MLCVASLDFEHFAAACRWAGGGGQVKRRSTHATARAPTGVLVLIP